MGVSAGHVGIENVKAGNRAIVTERDASDEITGFKGQWRVGGGEVAGARGDSVAVALVCPSQPHNVSPRLGKPFVGEPVAHRGIEASAHLSPPGMGKIIDDGPGQFVGLRKCAGIHGFSCSRINRLAVALENGLPGYPEHIADLLPRSARVACLLHRRGHQRLGPVLDVVRGAHQLERIVFVTQNRGGEDLAELAMKLLTSRRKWTRHMSMMN